MQRGGRSDGQSNSDSRRFNIYANPHGHPSARHCHPVSISNCHHNSHSDSGAFAHTSS